MLCAARTKEVLVHCESAGFTKEMRDDRYGIASSEMIDLTYLLLNLEISETCEDV